jgi:hypothetical protein
MRFLVIIVQCLRIVRLISTGSGSHHQYPTKEAPPLTSLCAALIFRLRQDLAIRRRWWANVCQHDLLGVEFNKGNRSVVATGSEGVAVEVELFCSTAVVWEPKDVSPGARYPIRSD